MKKSIAVLLADGAEPVEVVAPIDAWRRGGMDVSCVSIMGTRSIALAQGISMEADALLESTDLSKFDGIFIPGGSGGVENLTKSQAVLDAIRAFMAADKFVFSICAGPMVLNEAGVLEGRRATCYPGCEVGFPAGVYPGKSGIVVDEHLVTASGPAFALNFALVGLGVMTTQPNADEVAAGMLANLTS